MTQSSPPVVQPAIPTGQELFDQIMGHIEPELTLEGLKKLDETYKDETPEQLTQRKKRYAIAFERYDQAYGDYLDTLQAQVSRYRRDSIRQVEVEDRNEEVGLLDQLSHVIFKAA